MSERSTSSRADRAQDPLHTDSAKIMRLGGVAMSALGAVDFVFTVAKLGVEAAKDMATSATCINLAEDVTVMGVGVGVATLGARALDSLITERQAD